MKKRALEHLTEPPSRVMDAVHKDFPVEGLVITPADNCTKRNIERWRKRVNGNYPEPSSRATITIPDELTVTERGEPFVLFDVGETDRIICFSTPSNLKVSNNKFNCT